MGYRAVSWTGGADSSPVAVADSVIEDGFDSPEALERFIASVDVATVEFENIPRNLLEAVSERVPFAPSPEAIAVCQHREREKRFISGGGYPCAEFRVVDSADSLASALAELPASESILKTAEFGYDGKGQIPLDRDAAAAAVWQDFGAPR